MRLRLSLLAALAAALGLAAPGAEAVAPAQVPGVTATEIVLGGTVPLSGPAAAFGSIGPGAKAYFEHVNRNGGVHGRKIRYEIRDDGYDPGRTVQATRELVEQDGVFAIFNSAGTENALAVRPYLNQLKVPHLFLGTGASAFNRDAKRFPWSMGYLPSFAGEGTMYGRNIARTRPGARIAVLFENSDYGKDLLAGLKRGLARSKARIVATQTHAPTDADVNSQLAKLRASKADTLMIFTTPQYAIQSFIATTKLGWRPRIYLSAVSVEPTIMQIATLSAGKAATRDTISLAFVKDPTSPRWAKDRGVILYKQIAKRAGLKASDVYNYYGMTVAHTMVSALRKAGRSLTRPGLLRAAQSLDERNNPFLLPGIELKTSRTVYHPISKAQLFRYRDGRWQPFSGLLGARG